MSNGSLKAQAGNEHYIGIDVGTGSARACIINSTGDIKAVASKYIRIWQPKPEYYVRFTWKTPVILLLINLRNNPPRISGIAFPHVFVKSSQKVQSSPAQFEASASVLRVL
jgi:predicted NBD/HSP70 family sugar kinase